MPMALVRQVIQGGGIVSAPWFLLHRSQWASPISYLCSLLVEPSPQARWQAAQLLITIKISVILLS
jgi:hypothetical protein